jgi:hypothetical protein
MPDTRGRFFSVSREVSIRGANYRPAICYPLPSALLPAVQGMVEKGLAKIYSEKVRFVSGVAYPVKKPAAQPAPQTVEQPARISEKPARKIGKGASGRREFS